MFASRRVTTSSESKSENVTLPDEATLKKLSDQELGGLLLKLVEANQVTSAKSLITARPNVLKNCHDENLNTPLHIHMSKSTLDYDLLVMLYKNHPDSSTAENNKGEIPVLIGARGETENHRATIIKLLCLNPDIASMHSLEIYKELFVELNKHDENHSWICEVKCVKENLQAIAFDLFITRNQRLGRAIYSLFLRGEPLSPAAMPFESLFQALFNENNQAMEIFSGTSYGIRAIQYFLDFKMLGNYSDSELEKLLRELIAQSEIELALQLVLQRPNLSDTAISELKPEKIYLHNFLLFLKNCRQPAPAMTCQNKLYSDNELNSRILNAAVVKLINHLENGIPLDLPEIELNELMRPDSFTRKIIDKFSPEVRPTLLEILQPNSKIKVQASRP